MRRIPLADHNRQQSHQESVSDDDDESFNSYLEEIAKLRAILITVSNDEDLCQVISSNLYDKYSITCILRFT